MHDASHRIALWRFQLIASLLHLGKPRGELKRALQALAVKTHDHPEKGPIQVAFGTLEEWLYCYRQDGLDGLLPSRRRDLGTSRVIDDALAEEIETLARARPELCGKHLRQELAATQRERALPSLTTFYRFLRARGLEQRQVPAAHDHRAYAFDLAGDCWQSDVMYGPYLTTPDGRRTQAYLFAVFDDATRLVAHAQFYLDQHLASLKDCLKQALLKRGLPRRFYVDNGRIFRSRLLLAVAARLGIELLHTRPYRPQGRAKIERWFGTVRRSFLARVDVDRLDSVDHLNRLLFAWVEGEYHVTPHRALDGETPLDRWLRLSEGVRPLPRDVDLDRLFLHEVRRRVAKDGTFTVNSRRFEAGPDFVRAAITVRYDPFDLRRVHIEGPDGRRVEAFPVDLAGNRRVRRRPPAPEPTATNPPPLRSLEGLADDIASESPALNDDQPQKGSEENHHE